MKLPTWKNYKWALGQVAPFYLTVFLVCCFLVWLISCGPAPESTPQPQCPAQKPVRSDGELRRLLLPLDKTATCLSNEEMRKVWVSVDSELKPHLMVVDCVKVSTECRE